MKYSPKHAAHIAHVAEQNRKQREREMYDVAARMLEEKRERQSIIGLRIMRVIGR